MAIMKFKYWFMGFALIIIVAGFWYYYSYLYHPKDVDFLYVNGRIEGDEVNIGIKAAGRIKELRVKEGAAVKIDQIIAILDAKDLEAKLDQALAAKVNAGAQVIAAKSELKSYINRLEAAKTKRAYLVEEVESQIKIARADSNKKDADFKRFKELWKEKVISKDRFE